MGRRCGTGWPDSCLVLAALLIMLGGIPSLAMSHTAEDLPTNDHPGMAAGSADAITAGLTERLGEKIPLDLTFRDESGKPVRLADLVTVPTIILPVYYSCTNVCNFLQGGLAGALPGVKRKPGEEYRVISVSFDETETPALAAKYKRMYLASMNPPFPEDGWRFLTGDAQNIRRLTDAAGFRFARKGRDFIHPVASMVVAPDGTIVRYLYGTVFLPKDLTLALMEAREGKVGVTIRKVVGYCFTFDPEGKTYVFNLLRVSATVVILCTGGFLAFLLLTGRRRKDRKT
ncbi:SCO family protein [Geobacter sp. AOG1]|uniref:SCO family protein n=1 Tax=Geobacter sp. AOG1 TaxID=1566346 RepID=UPI001CC3AC68|nr:SCO family protein [Geobacter sp. AOG1]GFE56842.1 cytochrome-c oxidase [Geobacter sp. AOG1]